MYVHPLTSPPPFLFPTFLFSHSSPPPSLTPSHPVRNLKLKPSSDDLYSNQTFANWASTMWSTNKTGPYSLATGNAAAFLSFPVISTRWAELATALTTQNHSAYLPPDTHPTVAAGYSVQMKSLATALRSNGTAFFNLVMSGGASSGVLVDLHPLSRGTVNIDPANLGKEPLVDYRVLTNPLDPLIMADILRFTRRYHMDNPMTKDLGATEFAPGKGVTTDKQFADYLVEALSPSYYHPVGTCAMMPRELGGVVDEQLRVYGVQGLRVVDASVISTIPGANTCQTTYAIAEKVSALLLKKMGEMLTGITGCRFDQGGVRVGLCGKVEILSREAVNVGSYPKGRAKAVIFPMCSIIQSLPTNNSHQGYTKDEIKPYHQCI